MGTAEDLNVDELIAEIEAPEAERPMSAPSEGAPSEAPGSPAPESQWNGSDWEFEWNGKKIAPDSRDKAKIWMSQGYNYSQRMGELNKTHSQKVQEAEARAKAAAELEEKLSPYRQVDEYARQNKEWWDFVQSQWTSRQQNEPAGGVDIRQHLRPLEEKLAKFEQMHEHFETQQRLEAEKQQDQVLDGEIGSIRKDHPNIDLSALDPASGESLELRILKHAGAIGTTSFKAAFWDYLGPKLIEQAKAAGKEAIAKDSAVKAKKGILGQTPAPTKTSQPSSYVKGKSYNSLVQEALSELGSNQ